MKDQFSLFDDWLYEEDTGTLMCKCPNCGSRGICYPWVYNNPYDYCYRCGLRLYPGNFVYKFKLVYGKDAVCND